MLFQKVYEQRKLSFGQLTIPLTIDYSTAKRVLFPNLKPSTKTISIRLPESLIEHLLPTVFIKYFPCNLFCFVSSGGMPGDPELYR